MKKHKKIILSLIFILSLSILTTTNTLNASSLTPNQIQAIITLLKSFGADSATVAKVQASLEGRIIEERTNNTYNNPNLKHPIKQCVNLTRNLYLGKKDQNSNGEVSKLQRFLTQTGDYTYGEVTGYYGPATMRAVQRYQCRTMGICNGSPDSNGYGVVGPRTRGEISCGVSTSNVNTYSDWSIKDGDMIYGNRYAKNKIFVYFDTKADFDKVYYQTLKKIVQNINDVVLIMRPFPLQLLWKDARTNSEALLCAYKLNKDRAFDYLDLLFQRSRSILTVNDHIRMSSVFTNDSYVTAERFKKCILTKETTNIIDRNIEDGTRLGVKGTPSTFIVRSGAVYRHISGVVSYEKLYEILTDSSQNTVYTGTLTLSNPNNSFAGDAVSIRFDNPPISARYPSGYVQKYFSVQNESVLEVVLAPKPLKKILESLAKPIDFRVVFTISEDKTRLGTEGTDQPSFVWIDKILDIQAITKGAERLIKKRYNNLQQDDSRSRILSNSYLFHFKQSRNDDPDFQVYNLTGNAKASELIYGDIGDCGYSFKYPAYLQLREKDKKCFDGGGGVLLTIAGAPKSSLHALMYYALQVTFYPVKNGYTASDFFAELQNENKPAGIVLEKIPNLSEEFKQAYLLKKTEKNGTEIFSIIAQLRNDEKYILTISSTGASGGGGDVYCSKTSCILDADIAQHLVRNTLNSMSVDRSVLSKRLDDMFKIQMKKINEAQSRAKDVRRVADVRQLKLALEMFYDDNLHYPNSLNDLTPRYLRIIPTDPKLRKNYNYFVSDDKNTYLLKAKLETYHNSLKHDVDGVVHIGAASIACGTYEASDRVYCVKSSR